jgi:hypothetical protein
VCLTFSLVATQQHCKQLFQPATVSLQGFALQPVHMSTKASCWVLVGLLRGQDPDSNISMQGAASYQLCLKQKQALQNAMALLISR